MTKYLYKINTSAAQAHGSGTIAANDASTAVTGTTTAFTTELVVGDVLVVDDGQILSVAAITDNTHLTLAVATTAAISGATFDYIPLINLESLSPAVYPPKSTYRPYYEAVQLANGKARGLGRPIATWRWGFLTLAMRDKLRGYCTSKSADVYIRTRINESDAYGTFSAVMIWPDDEEKQAGRRLNFTIEFRNLVQL